MIKLAVHFGDMQRAEKYKKEFDMALPNKKEPMEDAPSGYTWPFFDCYIIAQVNETLGNIEIAKNTITKLFPWLLLAKHAGNNTKNNMVAYGRPTKTLVIVDQI